MLRLSSLSLLLPSTTLFHIIFLSLVFSHPASSLSAQRKTPRPVAVVTGASRGIGKGIAVELGRAGYKVYAIGRTTSTTNATWRQTPAFSKLTVEQTVSEIRDAGGKGHALPCDISKDEDLRAAIAKISGDNDGRIDVLVCSAYTVPSEDLKDNFWKHGGGVNGNFMNMWDAVNGVGLRQVYATCALAAPSLIQASFSQHQNAPLICLVSSFGGKSYTFNVAYGVGKAAIDRLAKDMAAQLRPYNVATTSIYPGLVRTEQNMNLLKTGEWDRVSGGGLDLEGFGESPAFSGKAVVALAKQRRDVMMKRSGKVEVVAELAEEFGFFDENGQRPASIRSLKYLLPNFVFPEIEREGKQIPTWIRKNVPDWKLPWSVFEDGPPPSQSENN